jgi:hypothetical protein
MHTLPACEDAHCGALSDAPPCGTSGPTHLSARAGTANPRCGALLRGLGRRLLIAGAAVVLAHLVGIRGDAALSGGRAPRVDCVWHPTYSPARVPVAPTQAA